MRTPPGGRLENFEMEWKGNSKHCAKSRVSRGIGQKELRHSSWSNFWVIFFGRDRFIKLLCFQSYSNNM